MSSSGMKNILLLVYFCISFIWIGKVSGSDVTDSITPILSKKFSKSFIVDGDSLLFGLKLNAPLSPGFSFVLTPHHPESVSMKSKYCNNANGEEVLVITRRDSYYLLTAIQNTPSFECTFEIKTYYVLNNPEYSLILTSPLSSPTIVDWTQNMFQAQLILGLVKSKKEIDSVTTTSIITLSLDTKTQPIKKTFLPLKFSLQYNYYVETLAGKNIYDLNKFMTVFSDCVDSNGEVMAKFHVQSGYDYFSAIQNDNIENKVLLEILDPSGSKSMTNWKCETSFRHFITPKITISVDLNRYANGNVDPLQYRSSFGKLKFSDSSFRMFDWNPNDYSTITGIMFGKGLYSEMLMTLDPKQNTCVVVRGMKSTDDEVIKNLPNYDPGYEISYNNQTDHWTVNLNNTSQASVKIVSTSLTDLTKVTWATCQEVALENPKLFKPLFIYNSGVDYSQLGLTDIRIYSPSVMTLDSPITIEFESLTVLGFNLAVKLPYESQLKYETYSECKAYNTTDRNEIDLNPDAYFKSTIYNTAAVYPDRLHLHVSPSSNYKLIICEVFGQYTHSTVNPVSLSGDNAEVFAYSSFPIKLKSENVRFEKYEEGDVQGLSTTVSSSSDDNTMSTQSTSSSTPTSDVTPTHSTEESAMSTQSTPSLQIRTSSGSGYYLEVRSLPLTLTKKNNNIIGKFFYVGEVDTGMLSFFSPMMASVKSGFVTYDMAVEYQDLARSSLSIVNHPEAIKAFNEGETNVELDFTLYIGSSMPYYDLSNKLFIVYSVDMELITQTYFPTLPATEVTFVADKGKGTYLTTHEQLMKSYLTTPEKIDSVPVTIKLKSKYAINNVEILPIKVFNTLNNYFDYIKDVKISFGVIPQINNIHYDLDVNQGTMSIHFNNEVFEYDEEMETTITFTTFINLPNIVVKYQTTHYQETVVYTEGVSGLASVVGLPDVISSGFVLDTSNLNFNYTDINTKTTLELGLPDLWTTHYFTSYKVECPVDNFNIFKWKSTEKNDQGDIVFNKVNTPITLTNIPTISSINLPITYTVDSTVKNSPKDIQTFTPLVYIPDFSHITNIVRVDKTGLPQPNTPITPDSDFIAFSITGYVFNLVSKLTIDLHQLPIRPVKCKQYDTIVPIEDVNTFLYSVERDYSNSNPFDYQEFTVTCEFIYRPKTEMRQGRYTGVLKATLESPTLGQSSTTFVNKAFKVVVPAVNPTDTDGKDTVTVNSQVTVRDTPATGLTPNQIDSLLDKYKEATNTVSGTEDSDVFIDDIKTYPVGENKYDTDVNIVIVPPETDSSLSLNDIQDINDKFVLDLGDSWEVSVAPPTYNVEVDECKGKCGVGCRLCRNGSVCTVDGDCLFKHCDSNTNKCTVTPDTDTDNGSYSESVRLSIGILALFSIFFI